MRNIRKRLTDSYLEDLIASSKIDVRTVFGKCTTVTVELPSGFVLVEAASPVNPDDYDPAGGYCIAIERIKKRLYELEGYRLKHQEMRREKCEHDYELTGAGDMISEDPLLIKHEFECTKCHHKTWRVINE